MKHQFIFIPALLFFLTACEPWELERISFPLLTTGDASELTANSATLSGELSGLLPQDQVEQHGHLWSSQIDQVSLENFEGKTERGREGNTVFTSTATGLQINKTYYFRAYAVFNGKTLYGDVKTLLTRDFRIDLLPPEVSGVGLKVRLHWDLAGFVGEAGQAGIVWSEQDTLPTITADGMQAIGSSTFNCANGCRLTQELSDLKANVTYYCRVFFQPRDREVKYSLVRQFRLLTPTPGWVELQKPPAAVNLNSTFDMTPSNNRIFIVEKPTSLWEYDPDFDTWAQRAGANAPILDGFAAGENLYYWVGQNGFAEYSPERNTWAPKAAFPETYSTNPARTAFLSIGERGWVGYLRNEGDSTALEVWTYEPDADSWRLTDNSRRFDPNDIGQFFSAFGANGKGYFWLGFNNLNDLRRSCWEFDPQAPEGRRWRQMDQQPATITRPTLVFTLRGRIYIGGQTSNADGSRYLEFLPDAPAGSQFLNISREFQYPNQSWTYSPLAGASASFQDRRGYCLFSNSGNREFWMFIPLQ